MAFAQLTGISLAFGDRDILKGVNFNLSSSSRTALAGPNGSGKSTLMKIIAGSQRADSGDIVVQKNARVAYLPQSGIVYADGTLHEEAERAFVELHDMHRRKEEVEHRLGRVTEMNAETESLLNEQHELEEHLLASGFYHRTEKIDSVLTGLGFDRADFGKESSQFSGGWQMRIALAKILLQGPDLLLLDEPTNYLDIEARTWLEEYLQALSGGYFIVSHDRYFLDVTVDEVAEMWNGRLKVYRGNYSKYEATRKQEIEDLVARHEAQEAEIAKVQEFINRFRYNASKATMVQSRIKFLEKLERIEIPESMKRVRFSFPPAPHSGKQIVHLEGLGKSYGPKQVLHDVDLNLTRGEKLVVVGRNGAGKSTLMRIIAGVDGDFQGSVRYGTGVQIGYFSQDIETRLDDANQIIEEVERDAPTHLYPSLRGLLGAFLFHGDDIHKPISVLSGGEKSRVALLKLLLAPANLLVLDEPTNHLDLRSKDVLLEALDDFGGTLVFVSHDRYFIEALATSVLELGPRGHTLFPGDYEYYLWKTTGKGAEPDAPAAKGAASRRNGAVDGSPAGDVQASGEDGAVSNSGAGRESARRDDGGNGGGHDAAGGSDRLDRGDHAGGPGDGAGGGREAVKRSKGELRKLMKERDRHVERIEQLERERGTILEELASPEAYTDGERMRRLKAALAVNEQEQQRASRAWEDAERRIAVTDA